MRPWHLSGRLGVLVPVEYKPSARGPSVASYIAPDEALPLLPYNQHGEHTPPPVVGPLTRERATAGQLQQQEAHKEATQGQALVRGYAHWLSISSWDDPSVLVIRETFRHTGTRIWRGALLHRAWAMQNTNEFANKSVLELGSGTGILGLSIAAACGPTLVTLSDFRGHFQCGDTVMHLLRDNTVDNMALVPTASVMELDWSHPTKPLRWALCRGEETITEQCLCTAHQCVIGTEIIYSDNGATLLAALLPLVLEFPNGVAYILNNKHRKGVATFPAECDKHGLHCAEIGWVINDSDEFGGATWAFGTRTGADGTVEQDEFVHFRVARSQ